MRRGSFTLGGGIIALLLTTLLATTPARAQLRDVTQAATLTAAAASPGACVYPPNTAPSCVKLSYEGYAGVGALLTGTFAATVVAEISADGGTTWTMVNLLSLVAFATPALSFVQTSGLYAFATLGGGNTGQVRVSAFGSGAVGVTMRATTASR